MRSRPAAGRVRGAAALALVFWPVAGIGTAAEDPAIAGPGAASMAIAMLIGVLWLAGLARPWPAGARVVALGLATALMLAATSAADPRVFANCGAIHAVLAIAFGPA